MTLVTNAFINLAQAEAVLFGLPNLPMQEVPHHPWYAVTPEEWRQDAEASVQGLVRSLTAAIAVAR